MNRRETWSDPWSDLCLGGGIVSAMVMASASLSRWVCRRRLCRCNLYSRNGRASGRAKGYAPERRSGAYRVEMQRAS